MIYSFQSYRRMLEQEPGRRAVVWAACQAAEYCVVLSAGSWPVRLRYLYCIVFSIRALLLGATF